MKNLYNILENKFLIKKNVKPDKIKKHTLAQFLCWFKYEDDNISNLDTYDIIDVLDTCETESLSNMSMEEKGKWGTKHLKDNLQNINISMGDRGYDIKFTLDNKKLSFSAYEDPRESIWKDL